MTTIMKKPDWTFALKLHRCKPESMPIGRLAEYLLEFAGLLGKDAPVRFSGIVKGSVVMRARALDDSHESIASRLVLVAGNQGTKDAASKADKLDAMMREDGIFGEVINHAGAVILPFPGAKRKVDISQTEYVVTQEGELTGVVTRIGGRDDTVPLTLEDADGVYYETNVKGRELARELGRLLFGSPIRVFGTGTWKRTNDTKWKLEKFIVQSYEELDTRPLSEVLAELRDIPGNGWAALDNPIDEWRRIRGN